MGIRVTGISTPIGGIEWEYTDSINSESESIDIIEPNRKVQVLIDVFDNLIDRGATVIVIEHDLDLIANADYIIDIGIDEDNNGGEILATGGLEDIINTPESLTGKYLAEKNLS